MKKLLLILVFLPVFSFGQKGGWLSRGISNVRPGTVTMFSGNTCPVGYLLCDGTEYDTASYPALNAAIGRKYALLTTGLNELRVPDARGYFPRFHDNTGLIDPDAILRVAADGTIGNLVGSIQQDTVGVHSHLYDRATAGTANLDLGIVPTPQVAIAPSQTGVTGAGETRSKNMSLLACIKF